MKHYYSAFVVHILGISLAYYIAGIPGALTAMYLCILETSLSFDNAVVNATVLNNWNHFWKQLFIWVGLPIAVFGMRMYFPIEIVSIVTDQSLKEVFDMAVNKPEEYAAALHGAHHQIAAFGGTFLLMVFAQFFIDSEKEHHWIPGLEHLLKKVGLVRAAEVAIAVSVLLVFSSLIGGVKGSEFLTAGLWGIVIFVIAKGLGSIMEGDEGSSTGTKIVRQGIMGLLYLEILDASFSFDGVIGAFALSNNIFIITIGLAVGAMYVRSMTLHLVEAKTLSTYRYLEHGAFWAIGVLAATMFIGTLTHIPEAVVGLASAVIIVAALIHSIIKNRSGELAAQH